MITLGVAGVSYPDLKNIVALPFQDVRVLRTHNVMTIPNYIARHVFNASTARSFVNCFNWDMGFTNVDIFHFFNRLSAPPRPWVVTFEHDLPRWNTHSRMGMRLLAGKSCGKVLAISDFAYRAQMKVLDGFPQYRDAIIPKMAVLQPPQPVHIHSFSVKRLDPDRISFVFLGRDFFRKGGMEVLTVFQRLLQEVHSVRLTIISSMVLNDYVTHATAEDVKRALLLMHSMKNHITYYRELRDEQVGDLLRDAHIGLLPTYDDTFGYSLLECQAAGTPVISTNVCALSEINNDEIGWLIRLPLGDDMRAAFATAEERKKLSRLITEQLYETIKKILANPGMIQQKATLAWERIRDHYTPEHRAEFLTNVYREVLSYSRASRRP